MCIYIYTYAYIRIYIYIEQTPTLTYSKIQSCKHHTLTWIKIYRYLSTYCILNVWNSILPRFRTRSKHVTGSVFLAGFWFHPVVSVASWLVFSQMPCRLMCAVCWLKLSATCSLSPIVLAQCHRAAWKPFVLAQFFRVFFCVFVFLFFFF